MVKWYSFMSVTKQPEDSLRPGTTGVFVEMIVLIRMILNRGVHINIEKDANPDYS